MLCWRHHRDAKIHYLIGLAKVEGTKSIAVHSSQNKTKIDPDLFSPYLVYLAFHQNFTITTITTFQQNMYHTLQAVGEERVSRPRPRSEQKCHWTGKERGGGASEPQVADAPLSRLLTWGRSVFSLNLRNHLR